MRKISIEPKLFLILLIPIIAVMVLHHLTTGFTIYSDGVGYYAYIRSAVIDQDIDFENELRFYNASYSRFSSVPRGVALLSVITPKGYVGNPYLIGNSVLWSPFFLTAHAASLLSSLVGLPIEADGYSLLYEISIGIATLVYGFLGVWLIYKFCRKWFGRNTSFLATVGVWYGTGVFWYNAVEPSMAHINSLLLGALFAYFWYSTLGRRTKLQWLFLGLLLGLIYLVRQTDIIFGILPALEVSKEFLKKINTEKIKKIALDLSIFASGMIIAVLPQMLIWKKLYGNFIVYSFAGIGAAYWGFPKLVQFFFSFEDGMWRIPLLFLAAIGLFLFAYRVKGISWYFVVAVVALIIVTSAWSGWNSDYGLRFLIGMSVFFALGLGEVIEKLRTRLSMKWVYAIFILLIIANFVNMLLFLFREVTVKLPLAEIPRTLIRTLL